MSACGNLITLERSCLADDLSYSTFSEFTRDERNCYLFVNTSAWNSCTALYRGKMK